MRVLGSPPMRAVLLSALLVTGCRIDLDHGEQPIDAPAGGRTCTIGTSTVCKNADSHSDFAFLKSQIFPISCSSSPSCHMSSTSSGKLDLSPTNAYKGLMGAAGTGGVMADVDKTRVLVVPGQPNQSYFYFMVQGIAAEDGDPPFSTPPSDVGLMPQNNKPLCCQKLDAIERWITAGALNN
jgi:hypothetical protein